MKKAPILKKDGIKNIYYNKYLKFYSMEWDNGVFYLAASRRNEDKLVANMNNDEYSKMTADAVTIILVIKTPGEEPKLYLENEFRYPLGRFVVSPPAGLIDPDDAKLGDPLIVATKREVREETGIEIKDSDEIKVISPLLYTTPGMTDESNALVCVTVELDDLSSLTDKYAEGSECFDGYNLLTREEAKKRAEEALDHNGNYYSIFTWAVISYFAYRYL